MKTKFTNRETDIIKLLIEGKNNKQIGESLYLSVHTIKRNFEHMFDKTGCRDRVQLVIWVMKNEYENFFY